MRAALVVALSVALVGCPEVPAPGAKPAAPLGPEGPYSNEQPLAGAARVAFTIPRPGVKLGFFDTPWPSEMRRKDGRPDFTDYPGDGAAVASTYVATAARDVDGSSTSPVVYFRFEGGRMAGARLPRPEETLDAGAALLLVDVDPRSPERGKLYPVEARVFEGAKFVPDDTLAVKPIAGVVLRPGTLYAAVVRRALGGVKLGTSRDLEIVKGTRPRSDPAEEAARAMHAPALDALGAAGVRRADVAAIAVFRTQIPQAITEKLLRRVANLRGDDAPALLSAAWIANPPAKGAATSYTVIRGTYCTPNFQSGIEHAPFAEEGGNIELDAGGEPVLVRLPAGSPYQTAACGGRVRARFFLSVPVGPMPAGGWPLMMSAHGTTGGATSFLGEDDFAGWAAREGIAVVSTDQPIHGAADPEGARPGSRETITLRVAGIPLPIARGKSVQELGFYNPLRPAVARDNLRQAAVDGYVLLHLMVGARLDKLMTAGGAPAPRFDASRTFYAGHSQGSQSAAVLGALDPSVRGVVLSGCGSDARLGILRRKEVAILPLLTALLGAHDDELDEFHPLLALAQTLADPIDPGSYARFYWERGGPRVLHFEGMGDTFNPNAAAEALAVALHATQIGPVLKAVPGLAVASGDAGDKATIAFAQLAPTHGENGHFVLYHEARGPELLGQFLRTTLSATRARSATLSNTRARFATLPNTRARFATLSNTRARFATLSNTRARFATLSTAGPGAATVRVP